MQAALLLVVALAGQAPATDPERLPLLALDLESNGVAEQEVKIINSLVVQALSRHPELAVLSSADVRQMVDLAAEQQAIGCDTSSCLAEIAGAMGASFVVYGQAGRLGDVGVVQLNLFDSQAGVAIAREKVETSQVGELSKLIEPAVDRLVQKVVRTPPPTTTTIPTTTTTDEGAVGVLPWVLVGGGAALALAGVVSVGVGLEPVLRHGDAQAQLLTLSEQSDITNLGEARERQLDAKQASDDWQAWGVFAVVGGSTALLVGAAAIAAGVAWALMTPAEGE